MSNNEIDVDKLLSSKGIAQKYNAKVPADNDLRWSVERAYTEKIIKDSPKLRECTEESVMTAFMQAASMGLSFNPLLNHTYLIPYNVNIGDGNNKVWEARAYCSPSYLGMIHLATTVGNMRIMRAEVVYNDDVFTYHGPNDKVTYQSKFNAKHTEDAAVGVFAEGMTKDGFWVSERMERSQVLSVRASSKQPSSLMWTKFWDQGWKKACLRRMFKTMPMNNPQYMTAIQTLNDHEGMIKKDEDVKASVEDDDMYINLDQQTSVEDMLLELKKDHVDFDVFKAAFLSSIATTSIDKIPAANYTEVISKLRSLKQEAESLK